jgi:hypothetical protein
MEEIKKINIHLYTRETTLRVFGLVLVVREETQRRTYDT